MNVLADNIISTGKLCNEYGVVYVVILEISVKVNDRVSEVCFKWFSFCNFEISRNNLYQDDIYLTDADTNTPSSTFGDHINNFILSSEFWQDVHSGKMC